MKSKYKGRCKRCGMAYKVGQEIICIDGTWFPQNCQGCKEDAMDAKINSTHFAPVIFQRLQKRMREEFNHSLGLEDIENWIEPEKTMSGTYYDYIRKGEEWGILTTEEADALRNHFARELHNSFFS